MYLVISVFFLVSNKMGVYFLIYGNSICLYFLIAYITPKKKKKIEEFWIIVLIVFL